MQVTNRVVNVVEEGMDVAAVRATLDNSGSMIVKRLGRGAAAAGGQPLATGARHTGHAVQDSKAAGTRWLRRLPTGVPACALPAQVAARRRCSFAPRYVVDDLLTLNTPPGWHWPVLAARLHVPA